MKIPKSFTIFGQKVNVEIVDNVDDNFGEFNSINSIIKVATSIKKHGQTIQLTEEQMIATFWHEVIHAFQFYIKGKYSEEEATAYGNALTEYFKSYEIN